MKRQDRYLILITAILGIMFPLWQNMSPFDPSAELHAPEKPNNYKEYAGVGEYLPQRVRGTSLRSVGESIAEHNLKDVKENIEDQLEQYVHDWGLDLVEDETFKAEENTEPGKRSPASLGRIALATPDTRVAQGKVGLQVMNSDSLRVRYRGDLDLSCEVKKDQTQIQMKWNW